MEPKPNQDNPPEQSWTPQPVANGKSEPTTTPPTSWDSSSGPGLSSASRPKKSKKKLFIALTAIVVLIGLSLGTVFGYYLPNKPENVYSTGLDRSGQAIDKLVDKATEKDKLQQIKKSEIDGVLEVTSKDESFSGALNIKLDPTKSDGKFDLKIKEGSTPEKTLGLKFLSDLKKDKRFPDVYFQLTGLKALGADTYVPGLSDYEGKWIVVEADFLESLGKGFIPPNEQKNKENVSAEEISQLIRDMSDVTNEYVFTSNKEKAVLENREYLGKEKTEEGINAFHYKVGINNEHAKAYCKAISDKFLSEAATRKLGNMDEKDIASAKKSANEDCDNTAKNAKNDETFELWIDAKYKVVHKFRVYSEKDKKDTYTDFGQIYTGGDKLALFMRYHQDKDNVNAKFTLDTDINTANSKAELSGSQEGDSGATGKASLEAKPYGGELKADKPAGAIPIKDILARFGFDPTALSGISEPGSRAPGQASAEYCAHLAQEAAGNPSQPLPAECQ